MTNNFYKKQLSFILALSVCVLLLFFLYNYSKNNTIPSESSIPSSQSVNHKDLLPYLHGDNSFSFLFPADLHFSNFAEDVAGETHETAVFSSTDTKNGQERGLQISIAPYKSRQKLDIEAITSSNNDLKISEATYIDVATERGLSFLSHPKNSNFTTLEVWFVHRGKIYQISSYPAFKDDLSDMLATWKWSATE